MKQKLINIYKRMILGKETLISYLIFSAIMGDKTSQTVSFVGLLIMWYIDNKERKPKDEFTLKIDGRDIVKD